MTTETSGFHHFIQAQAPVYDQVLCELANGRKRTHWMWFVFPQLRGLERSATAERYLAHDLLGPRLVECTRLVLAIPNPDPKTIFGYPDWMKFRSSMTLFSLCERAPSDFSQAIDQCFAGIPDEKTLRLVAASRP